MDIRDIRKLCALYWNPIGVPMSIASSGSGGQERPLPDDEYDTYLLKVAEIIDSGGSRDDVYRYLDLVEREYLMISTDRNKKEKFIDKLFLKLPEN